MPARWDVTPGAAEDEGGAAAEVCTAVATTELSSPAACTASLAVCPDNTASLTTRCSAEWGDERRRASQISATDKP